VISIEIDSRPADAELREFWRAAWGDPGPTDFGAVLSRSLAYLCARDGQRVVGFVNIAWDGGKHASIFDTAVHPEYRHRGIGTRLVNVAIDLARQRGARWLHVDFEPHLADFYRKCGFRPTAAGLIELNAFTGPLPSGPSS
jgi:ribosomal protein S18 acetylase RimI-like enzyme